MGGAKQQSHVYCYCEPKHSCAGMLQHPKYEQFYGVTQYTLIFVQVNVSDYSSNCWLSCFNETAQVILNCDAQKLGEMRDQVRVVSVFGE